MDKQKRQGNLIKSAIEKLITISMTNKQLLNNLNQPTAAINKVIIPEHINSICEIISRGKHLLELIS
jgi:hypothetical protein